MIIESILNEMEQRPGEKTHNFLARQQTAKNIIRKMNALEVHLSHVMSDVEPTGRMGNSIRNANRIKAPKETKRSISSLP